MSFLTCQTAYKSIQTAWITDESMSDIYHMILHWMETHKPDKECPAIASLVEEFMERAVRGDETNDLVEDFIYGERYTALRHAFE